MLSCNIFWLFLIVFVWFLSIILKIDLKSWAVKSWVSSRSSWFLIREEEILRSLGACLQCFGGHSSTEVDGSLVYNLILEYARRKSEEFDGEAQR